MYGCCVVVLNEISFSATLLTGCLSEGKIEKCVYTVYNKRGKKNLFYIFQKKVCLLLVSDSDAMLNVFLSYLSFQNLTSLPQLFCLVFFVSPETYTDRRIYNRRFY